MTNDNYLFIYGIENMDLYDILFFDSFICSFTATYGVKQNTINRFSHQPFSNPLPGGKDCVPLQHTGNKLTR